jgi:hypothetical protein
VLLDLQEEEEERSDRWKNFIERQAEDDESSGEDAKIVPSVEDEGATEDAGTPDMSDEKTPKQQRPHKIQIWSEIRPSLGHIGEMMSLRIKKKKQSTAGEEDATDGLQPINAEDGKPSEDSDDEFYDVEKVDPGQEGTAADSSNADSGINKAASQEGYFPWKEELECLVRGGLPMALRGEVRIGSLLNDIFVILN